MHPGEKKEAWLRVSVVGLVFIFCAAIAGCSGSAPTIVDGGSELEIIDAERFHEVKARETLYGIARSYKTTVHVLLELNPGIDPASLQIGSLIRIPAGKAAVRAIEPAGKRE